MTKDNQSDERLSRRFSHALRHNPGQYGLTARSDGSVNLAEFVRAMNTDIGAVRRIVNADEKGRYIIEHGRIWATQGHSFPVQLKLENVDEPGTIYHGTKAHLLDSIRAQGLVPGARQKVHLSATLASAEEVSNRRKGTRAILAIDGDALVLAGHPVWRAENGVLLADIVPWAFVSSVGVG